MIAVTGLGALCNGGEGVDALWRVCIEGGIVRPIEHFDVSGTGARTAGFVPTGDDAPPPGSAGRLPYLLHRAVRGALADAAARTGDDRRPNALVMATTDSGDCSWVEDWRAYARGDAANCRPGWAPPADAPLYSCPVLAVGNASAAGAAALGVATDLIRSRVAERVVACGVDTVTEIAFHGLAALRTLSPAGCRPFAARRSGIHIAEGAGAVVLDAGPARAGSYAVLGGWGASNEADQPARPDVGGVAKAVTRALADAGVEPSDLGYVNAHAAGTRHGDTAELAALTEVVGPDLDRVPVVSSKAALGHCQGAAGTLEAIMTVLTLDRGELLPTLGLTDPDPRWAHLDLARGEPRRVDAATGLSISCGLGGSNVALVFGRVAG